jgi:release factor glutamine methyltransferase
LDIIRELLAQAREKLNPGGCLLVEIGATQGAVVTRLAQKTFAGARVELKQDLAGLDRVLVVQPENV